MELNSSGKKLNNSWKMPQEGWYELWVINQLLNHSLRLWGKNDIYNVQNTTDNELYTLYSALYEKRSFNCEGQLTGNSRHHLLHHVGGVKALLRETVHLCYHLRLLFIYCTEVCLNKSLHFFLIYGWVSFFFLQVFMKGQRLGSNAIHDSHLKKKSPLMTT